VRHIFTPIDIGKNEQMIIPYEQLSSDALQGLIEEFITREGTDYGIEEVSLSTKTEQIKNQLKRREVVVVFDVASESVSILSRRDAELLEQDSAT
jgi:uncharacterized protein YheU (UPF0270 family)